MSAFCPNGIHFNHEDRGLRGPNKNQEYCKPCMTKYQREWHHQKRTNPEARQKRAAYMRIYNAQVDPVTGKRRDAAMHSRSPEAYLRTLRTKALARADDKNRVVTVESLVELWKRQNGRCAITGELMTYERGHGKHRLDTNVSLDRIDSERGYESTNVQLVCVQVNIMKQKLSTDQLRGWCRLILGIGT